MMQVRIGHSKEKHLNLIYLYKYIIIKNLINLKLYHVILINSIIVYYGIKIDKYFISNNKIK